MLVGSSALPEATEGAAYARTLSAVGCTTTCTWSLAPGQGALPDGLSLSSAGVLSGKATQTGVFPFTLLATDPAMPSQPGVQHLTLTVVQGLQVNAQNPLPDAVAGTSWTQQLKANGGTQPFTWAATAKLPSGWTLDPATGVLSAASVPSPAKGPATVTITVRVTDSGQPALTTTHAYTVRVVAPLLTTTSGLPQAVDGKAYQAAVAVTGGVAPYAYTLTGTLPDKLKLDPQTGTISGPVEETGSFPVTVQTTDAGTPSQTTTQHLTLDVVRPLQLDFLTLPDAVAGTQYAQTLTASGGSGAYSWSVVGALPQGLALDPSTGVLSGTPGLKAVGTSTFTVQVADSGQPPLSTDPQTFTLTVVAPLVDTTADAPQGVYGKPYDVTDQSVGLDVTASGGTSPYTVSQTDTPLPPGLSLRGGRIVGQPTATGVFPVSVQLTDSSSPPLTITEHLSITVVGSLTISPDPLPDGVTGKTYAHKVTAVGGVAPYTWSWAPADSKDKLPDGLTLNAATGLISGTPTTAASTDLVITVSDSGGPVQSATWPVTLTVSKPLGVSYQAPSPEIQGQLYSLVPTLTDPSPGVGYSWALTGGVLPAGLSLDSTTGFVTGFDTATPGTYAFTVTVSDSADHSALARANVSVVVLKPLAVAAAQYTWSGTIGTPFGTKVAASGGQGPYKFTLTPEPGSTLTGIDVDLDTGVVHGTPDGPCSLYSPGAPTGSPTGTQTVQSTCQPDTFDGLLTVTDELGESASAPVTLSAAVPALEVAYKSFPVLTQKAGGQFTFDLHTAVTGGYPGGAVTYAAPGLPCGDDGCDSIDSTGHVTGQLDGLGQGTVTFTVTVTSTDPHNSQNTVTAEFQATIDTAPATPASPTPGAPK